MPISVELKTSQTALPAPTPLSTLRDMGDLGLGETGAVLVAQMLADSGREGIVFVDKQGRVLMANGAANSLFGAGARSQGQPIGQLLQMLEPDGSVCCGPADDLFGRLCAGETCTVGTSQRPGECYFIHQRPLPGGGRAFALAWLRKLNSPGESLLRAGGLDSLTGYAGRQSFENALSQALDRAQGGASAGLLYLDLYQFKVINESCGNDAGDELLKQVANLLVVVLRGKDMLARLGSDEFGILLSDCSLAGAQQMASRIVRQIEDYRFSWSGQEFSVGISIGVLGIGAGPQTANQLLAAANAACNGAKASGRNRIKVYHSDDKVRARQQKMQWLSRIQKALQEDRFELYQQTIVGSGPEQPLHHCEVLLRMRAEDGEVISPGQFIPAAEQFGLMEELDRLVLRKVLNHMAAEDDGRHYAVNVSGASLGDSKYCDYVISLLAETRVDAGRLHFEITETAAISRLRSALDFMHEMTRRGCKFYLDDFGRGQSSLAYLRELPVHYIKIDGLFVKNMLKDSKDYAMVSTINHLAHVMGLKTVAEYVEDEDIANALRDLGVDYLQGYAIAHPRPL